jgi:hypothetical protein
MKTAKVKELKDDAIMTVEVNKNFYLMVKAVLFQVFKEVQKEGKTNDFTDITKKPYEELTESQRSFYTLTLLLAEIERQATLNNLFDEKEFTENDVNIDDDPTD